MPVVHPAPFLLTHTHIYTHRDKKTYCYWSVTFPSVGLLNNSKKKKRKKTKKQKGLSPNAPLYVPYIMMPFVVVMMALTTIERDRESLNMVHSHGHHNFWKATFFKL